MSQLIHVFADRASDPWPDVWRAEDLRCVSGDDHLAPLDVLLPGGLPVRVLHPYVGNHDRPGSYEILRYLSIHATDKGLGRGLSVFATLEDPLPARPKGRGDVLAGLARALDAAVGAEARRTRHLLQAFLAAYGDVDLSNPAPDTLSLVLPQEGRRTLRLLSRTQGSSTEILAKRLPPVLAGRAARLRLPGDHGDLVPARYLSWLPAASAHAALAAQADLEAFLDNA